MNGATPPAATAGESNPPVPGSADPPPLPKPEDITSVTQLFGLLRGHIDYEAVLEDLREARTGWRREGAGPRDGGPADG